MPTCRRWNARLRATRAQLEAATDDLETQIEDMKSTTEEFQSVNEELQSSNEELETAKEEMQSVNEELQTINTELNNKNELLTRLNSDMQNLLDSTQIATVFLDGQLRIKHFTPTLAPAVPGARQRPRPPYHRYPQPADVHRAPGRRGYGAAEWHDRRA